MARSGLKGGIRVFSGSGSHELRGFWPAHGGHCWNKRADGAKGAFPGINRGISFMLLCCFWRGNEYLLLLSTGS